MVFMLGKNLAFINSIQFLNSSLENLVKYLLGDKFKYLSQELSKKAIRNSKTKRNSFEDLLK